MNDDRSFLARWWARDLLVLAAFTMVGLFFASRTYILYNSYPDNSITWAEAVRPALVDWYLWAALAPIIAWLAFRHPIERGRSVRAVTIHVLAGAAVAMAKVALDNWVGRPLSGLDPGDFGRQVWMSFHPNLMTYGVIVGLVHAVHFYRRFRERELRATQLEARLARTRLQVLRMQLQPHFLFNTLHAIGTLMHRDVDAAERMLARLSDLLRITIEDWGAHEVPLKAELEFLERYLEIERTRFADRLTVSMDIDPSALDLAVPRLILQPIVENAIRHGIAPRAGPGRIEISAERSNGLLHLSVRDDGIGLARTVDDSEGLGLANTRARLEELYGSGNLLAITDRPEGGVEVRLTIPGSKADSDS